MRRIKLLLGTIIFSLTNRIELRYFMSFASVFVEHARVFSLRILGAKIGENSYIRAGLFVTTPCNLVVGNNTKIGPRSELYTYTNLTVGNNVEIGSGLIVHTSEHMYSNQGLPLTKQGSSFSPVRIDDDVYIGSRVTVLSGVKIGKRSIVAAGAVVNKDLRGGSIYGGVPVKKIKSIEKSP